MKKNKLLMVIALLVISNSGTYLYHKSINSDLRSRSSFMALAVAENLPSGAEKLVACLSQSGIEQRTEDGNVLVREVDMHTAVARCS